MNPPPRPFDFSSGDMPYTNIDYGGRSPSQLYALDRYHPPIPSMTNNHRRSIYPNVSLFPPPSIIHYNSSPSQHASSSPAPQTLAHRRNLPRPSITRNEAYGVHSPISTIISESEKSRLQPQDSPTPRYRIGSQISSSSRNNRGGKLRSNLTPMDNTTKNELRVRFDRARPLTLQLSGDMEGRTLQLVPAENGFTDIVIGGGEARRHSENPAHYTHVLASGVPESNEVGVKPSKTVSFEDEYTEDESSMEEEHNRSFLRRRVFHGPIPHSKLTYRGPHPQSSAQLAAKSAGTSNYSASIIDVETQKDHKILRNHPEYTDVMSPTTVAQSTIMQNVQWDHVPYGSSQSSDPSAFGSSNSYASSVISTVSQASSATDLSKHSGYSITQIEMATTMLILVLQEDARLASLYEHAIIDTSIGPERLERNLRRMLRSYGEMLGKAAGDNLEFRSSQLVKAKARAAAHAIVQSYDSNLTTVPQTKIKQDQEASSDEEAEPHQLNDSVFEDLQTFREFLIGGEPFVALHAQMRAFILPKSALPTFPQHAVDELEKDKTPSRNYKEQPASTKQTMSRVRSYKLTIRSILEFFDLVFVALGYLEPPLAPGFTRLRWQCVSTLTIASRTIPKTHADTTTVMWRQALW
jgi:hypothetical protein